MVIDDQKRELHRWSLGSWFPLSRTVAFADVEQVGVRVVLRGGAPISYIVQATLKSGTVLPIDSRGGHTPLAEVEALRSALEGRFTAR